ncbi:MAG: hypothetical protein C0594_09635 [Marinilabiliales bacterium]|nr:MAG: hypothetical protein C0594_09635 [Marinilabiliales bacterium]
MRFIVIVFVLFLVETGYSQTDEAKEKLANQMIEAMHTLDKEIFIQAKPTIEMWKVIDPEGTVDLTDQEIEEKFIDNKNLSFSYGNIVESVKKENIAREEIKFESYDYEELGGTPVAMTVFFRYKEKKGSIWFSIVTYNHKLYLNEIKNSYMIFSQME